VDGNKILSNGNLNTPILHKTEMKLLLRWTNPVLTSQNMGIDTKIILDIP